MKMNWPEVERLIDSNRELLDAALNLSYFTCADLVATKGYMLACQVGTLAGIWAREMADEKKNGVDEHNRSTLFYHYTLAVWFLVSQGIEQSNYAHRHSEGVATENVYEAIITLIKLCSLNISDDLYDAVCTRLFGLGKALGFTDSEVEEKLISTIKLTAQVGPREIFRSSYF